tara:strand:+ start:299 stop:529 length:231 start_codon:yes stop_codon:yes gene_type:complete
VLDHQTQLNLGEVALAVEQVDQEDQEILLQLVHLKEIMEAVDLLDHLLLTEAAEEEQLQLEATIILLALLVLVELE